MAVLEGNKVINIILASDDEQNTESLVTYTDENSAFIGGDYVDGYFYPEQPFPSWSRDGKGNWLAPKPKPEGQYYWDENAQEWVNVEANA